MRSKVAFLGYVVSAGGVSADPGKVRAVTEFPTPSELRTLHGFLGLTSYVTGSKKKTLVTRAVLL